MRTALLAAAVFVAAAILGNLAAGPELPACPEDSVLVGVGDFDSGGWTSYRCGPAIDDYAP